MGQWIERAADLQSVTTGVLVQPCVDRITLMITNLSAATLHISPVNLPLGQTGGLPLTKNLQVKFNWNIDGSLARCQWLVLDATGVEEVSVIESLYLETGESEDG
jgi:hypothetical protein